MGGSRGVETKVEEKMREIALNRGRSRHCLARNLHWVRGLRAFSVVV